MSKQHRRVVQIAVATDAQSDTNGVLVALCDDGSIWKKWTTAKDWHQVDTSTIESTQPPKKKPINWSAIDETARNAGKP